MEKTKKVKLFLLIFGVWLINFAIANSAQAATLYFSPSSGQYPPGSSFSISVYVNSPNQSMNAASGTVSFSPEALEVSSVSKSGSIFSLWVQEPTVSNKAGTVNFEGIVLNPGFTGSQGKVLTINFKTRVSGNYAINFSSASVLANDGQGTNIIDSLGTASFTILGLGLPNNVIGSPNTPVVEKSEVTPSLAVGTLGLPPAPIITSSSHANQDQWYNNKNVTLAWTLPSDVTAVRLSIGKLPRSVPTVLYSPPIKQKELPDLSDGVWYFHAQFRNRRGWSPVTDFKINIDTLPPRPMTLVFPHGNISTDNRPAVLFNTTDELSGLISYEVKIGSQPPYRLVPGEVVESNPYVVPPQKPGNYAITVLAYDKAGNTQEVSGEFDIIGLTPPEFNYLPGVVNEGDLIKFQGRTYPNSTVVVSVTNNNRDKETLNEDRTYTNNLGQFGLVWPVQFKSGTYQMSAIVIDENSSRSEPTKPVSFQVKRTNLLRLGGLVFRSVVWLVILIVVIMTTVALAWYEFRKRLRYQKIVRNNIIGFANSLSEMLIQLEQDLLLHIRKPKTIEMFKECIKKMMEIINNIRKI